jgi:hypothetical protein
MASSFDDDKAAMLAEVFADLGKPAVYTPSGGGAAVPGIFAIPEVRDVENLGIDFTRTRQVKRLVALLRAHVADRPAKGARIVITGFGDFTVMEEAVSEDRDQLIWLCAVAETP